MLMFIFLQKRLGGSVVAGTRLSTIGNEAFPVAVARVWNSLPQHVTSATSLSAFRSRLKTHPFRCCYFWLHPSLGRPTYVLEVDRK